MRKSYLSVQTLKMYNKNEISTHTATLDLPAIYDKVHLLTHVPQSWQDWEKRKEKGPEVQIGRWHQSVSHSGEAILTFLPLWYILSMLLTMVLISIASNRIHCLGYLIETGPKNGKWLKSLKVLEYKCWLFSHCMAFCVCEADPWCTHLQNEWLHTCTWALRVLWHGEASQGKC